MIGMTEISPGEPVALIAQHRVADAHYAAYCRWIAGLVERLRRRPGFVSHEVAPPAPPEQLDWIMVARFADAAAARGWLDSPERAAALGEARRDHLFADEDVHLMEDKDPRPQGGASAFIAYDVPPEKEAAFLAWQQRIYAVEVQHPGFVRHKIERPVPGVRDEWIIVFTFDSDASLTRWLRSAERRTVMAEGGALDLAPARLSRTSYGFDFWFRDKDAAAPTRWTILKNNLLVLAVLNPLVYLWGSGPGAALGAHGAPIWLVLFLGNLVCTQLLGWWLAPLAFKLFRRWLAPDLGFAATAAGYGVLAVLYAVSMALGAALLGR